MKIAIITPAKDELSNIKVLRDCISKLDHEIFLWVIVENDSVDGTREYVSSMDKPDNVRYLHVMNLKTDDPSYKLGFKYARIIEEGMNYIKNSEIYNLIDYVGILDADCFPGDKYYNILLEEFSRRPDLGILSGALYDEHGRAHRRAKGFPRGNCRLWRRECLESSGYIVGMSADALSAIKAEIAGWECDSIDHARVVTREVGHRAGMSYYGRSAYYRGETFVYTLLKSLHILMKSRKDGIDYLLGYINAAKAKESRCHDVDIIKYSEHKMSKLVHRFFSKLLLFRKI